MSDLSGRSSAGELVRLSAEERLNAAEEHIRVLADVLHTLVNGLEPHPLRDDNGSEAAHRAAQQAHEQLLAAGL
jgi:signal transduction histidine kinase